MGEKGKGGQSAASAALAKAERALRTVTALFFAAMVAIVFFNVMSRYFFGISVPWTEEVARFLLIYIVFIGAVVAYMRDEHLGLDILLVKTPPVVARCLSLVAHLLSIGALGFMAYGGFGLAAQSLSTGWTSPAAGIPYGVIYAVVPATMAIMTVQALLKTVRIILGFRAGEGKE